MAKENFSDKLAAFLARKPTLAEAEAQVTETIAEISRLRERLADVTKQADNAALAAAEGMPGADTQRDRLRAEAREIRDSVHDAETLLQKRRERLEDAKSAERAKAVTEIWDQAETHFTKREDAARRMQDAVAALGKAWESVSHETSLLHVLLEGKAVNHLDLAGIRGTVDVLLTEAITGRKTHIDTRPLAEIAAGQHAQIRYATKL